MNDIAYLQYATPPYPTLPPSAAMRELFSRIFLLYKARYGGYMPFSFLFFTFQSIPIWMEVIHADYYVNIMLFR
jgi:hypothetical protein